MLNERQKAFCEYYAATGNATQAAVDAGYSRRTAYSQGQRLLKNVEVQNYLRELSEPEREQRILSANKVQEFLSKIVTNTGEKTGDRIKAGSVLLRSTGAMQPNRKTDDAELFTDEFPGSAKIFLPIIDGEDTAPTAALIDGELYIKADVASKEDTFFYNPQEYERKV